MYNNFLNNNPLSSNQLRVSQSYFMPPSAGSVPQAAYGALNSPSFNPWMTSAASYANTGFNTAANTVMPWGSQSLLGQNFGQTSLPSSVMQGGTYAMGQFNNPAAYFVSPQAGAYMPINSLPGLSSYPGAFSVRPQGPSYGYPGGDQFISGPYTGGYDVTGLYEQAPAFPHDGFPVIDYPSLPPVPRPLGGRRPNPFDISRYFVSPQELLNGFDFGLSSILNNKPGSLSGAQGFGQFTSDLSFLINDPLFSQFLDMDAGSTSTNNSSSSSIESILASLGLGSTPAPAASGGSDSIDALLASFLGTSGTSVASIPLEEGLDPALAAALADFNAA